MRKESKNKALTSQDLRTKTRAALEANVDASHQAANAGASTIAAKYAEAADLLANALATLERLPE